MKAKSMHYGLIVALAIIPALIISGCAPAAPAETQVSVEPQLVEGESRDSSAVEEPAAEEAAADPSYAGGPLASGSDDAASGMAERTEEAAEGMGGGGPAVEVMPPMATAMPQQNPPLVPADEQFQFPLQAGEIDDNGDFAAYLQYRLDFHSFLGYPVEELDVTERHVIRVANATNRPVLGADVMIYAGQNLITSLHTPATGIVYFFPRAYPAAATASAFDVVVQRGNRSESFTLTRGQSDTTWNVTLSAPASRPPVQLDVLFLIDATGSMGDEIDELKNNLLSISAQVAALPSRPDVRFGMVSYRDRGDQYVSQTTDFTGNVQSFQRELMNVQAGGGGDDPESLREALYNAIYGPRWRGGETVSLVFLVADAPPHLDYPQDYHYADSLLTAASAGIKIHPIASRLCEHRDTCAAETRAYQEQAEYIFRQMAQFTGGRFIFLTYEDTPTASGTPGSEVHVSEDSYSVQDLDALVVRLIEEELAALEGGQQ